MNRLGRSVSFFFLLINSLEVLCERWRGAGGFLGRWMLIFVDAFIRDELSKGRYDAALSGVCFEMLKELFNRTLRSDLGPRSGGDVEIEDIC